MAIKKKSNKIELCSDFNLFQTFIKGEYGVDALIDADNLLDPEGNTSGSLRLDLSLRVPFPQGRIIEIFGPEGSNKTSIGLEVLGNAQKRGKRVAYVRAEKNLNRYLLENIKSIDLKKKGEDGLPTFVLLKGNTGERNLELTEKFAASWKDCVIVVDSVDALLPEAAIEGNVGDSHIGLLSRLMSASCRRLDSICEQSGATVIFINQVRSNIGGYGDPDVSSGGKGLGYYSSQRIKLLKIKKDGRIRDKNTGGIIGHDVRYTVVKNKLAPIQDREETIPILFGRGIYIEQELSELLRSLALVETNENGKMIKIEDKFMHIASAAEFFISNPNIFQEYYGKLLNLFKEDEV